MRGAIEIKNDIRGYAEWENETCEVGLWAIDLDWTCIVCDVTGHGRIKNIDEGAWVKDTVEPADTNKQELYWQHTLKIIAPQGLNVEDD